jgi:hypothetical protein
MRIIGATSWKVHLFLRYWCRQDRHCIALRIIIKEKVATNTEERRAGSLLHKGGIM